MGPGYEDSKQGRRPRRREHRAPGRTAFAALLGAALAAAGCGGSLIKTTAQSSTSGTGASTTAAQAQSASGGHSQGTRSSATVSQRTDARSHDQVVTGNLVQRPAPGTGRNTINDDHTKQTASHADSGSQVFGNQPNPCRLVSQAYAESIIGQPILVPRMVPLGPTCLYQTRGSKNPVTLSIEALNFSKIEPHMLKVTKLRIRGLTGYCGTYGRAMTFVPLANRTVLNVTAPCSIGAPMAADAISRLTS